MLYVIEIEKSLIRAPIGTFFNKSGFVQLLEVLHKKKTAIEKDTLLKVLTNESTNMNMEVSRAHLRR